jgi:hypothetical protein
MLGAYGVLGIGITDAAVADPSWRVVTAGRRPPPAHHFSEGTAPPNVSVDTCSIGNRSRPRFRASKA